MRRHGLLFDSLQGRHHLLPLRCQLSQYCSGRWAIRQLTAEDAIRHGFSDARSDTVMEDTLATLSHEPKKKVTKLNRKSLGAPEKSGHHSVPGRDQEVSGVVRSARLGVTCQKMYRRSIQRDGSSLESNFIRGNRPLALARVHVHGPTDSSQKVQSL